MECATLPVPLDHARPAAGTINLALIRAPARQPHRRIGSLVMLAGGPGQSGVGFIRDWLGFFGASLRDRFDIVGFDQRGVGGSAPVRCSSGQDNDPPAATSPFAIDSRASRAGSEDDDVYQELVDDRRQWAQGCVRFSGAELPYLSTEAAARDLDLLRAALGEDKITSYGGSYGTVLGATYASMFPTRIRALVLDGVEDPNVWMNQPQEDLRRMAQGFETALGAFLADCKARPNCGFGHGDPAGAFDRLVERLIEKPIPAGGKDTGAARTLNWVTAMIGVRSALYSHAMWPRLAEALALADDNNDGSKLLSFAAQDPIGAILPLPYSTSTSADVAHTAIAAHTAITCADKVFPTVGAYQRLADELNRESPHFGLLSGLGALACVVWPVKAASRYTGPFHATGAAPILLVGSTGDPATPYSGAVSLARQLANSVLLTWRSYTHTAYFQDSGCVRQAVERYLVDLILPKRGTICPDVPTAAGS
ncbi:MULTISPECIES: alpha/beta hydrolase [Frankia]|nr:MULTISPECIES: alpha/beta hydrolase [Frankia]